MSDSRELFVAHALGGLAAAMPNAEPASLAKQAIAIANAAVDALQNEKPSTAAERKTRSAGKREMNKTGGF